MAGSGANGGWGRRLSLRCALILSVAIGGCAPTPGWQFADEPGVPASLSVRNQGVTSGSLVGYEDGSFVFERAYDRGEDIEVIRVAGTDYVYDRGVVVGTAVEIRDFDIVTRQRVSPRDVGSLDVKTRAYAGWGTVVAGVLAFFLVMVLEDT
jgi:hypothetical protein